MRCHLGVLEAEKLDVLDPSRVPPDSARKQEKKKQVSINFLSFFFVFILIEFIQNDMQVEFISLNL